MTYFNKLYSFSVYDQFISSIIRLLVLRTKNTSYVDTENNTHLMKQPSNAK